MKMIPTLLLMLMLLNIASIAQITITSSDMPFSGDTIRTSNGVNASNFDFARTGINLVWDFTSLENAGQQVDTFMSVTETPVIFWPFFLTSSNLAQKLNSSDIIPGLDVESGYRFFNRTSSAFTDIGTGLILNGLPLPLKYTDPDVLYRFPMSTGFLDTVDSFLEVAVPDLGYLMIDRNRINQVDGWGLLKTPFGEFEVLRLKSIVSEYDSIYVDSLGIGFPFQRNYIEYKWLGKEFGIPLLQVTIDEFLSETIIFIDSVRGVNVGLPHLQQKAESLLVYPNPVQLEIHVALPAGIQIIESMTVFNSKGVECFRIESPDQWSSNRHITIDLTNRNLKNGMYFIAVVASNQLYSAKFLITD